MSPELSPIILGVGAWSVSFIARYSLKSFLKEQTFKRKDINDGMITDINLKDTILLKNIAPIAIGFIGIIAGLYNFSALSNNLTGSFLISMGAAHLIENLISNEYLLHRGVK